MSEPPSGGLRTVLRRRSNPMALLETLSRQGDVASATLGTDEVVLLSHPDHVKDVLVAHHRNFIKGYGLQDAKRVIGNGILTSEGAFHRRQRRLVQPSFHHQRIDSYAETMAAYAERAQALWSGGERDVHRDMTDLGLTIVAKTLLDTDLGEGEETALWRDAFATTLQAADRMSRSILPAGSGRSGRISESVERSKATLDALIYRIIGERRRSGEDRGDLLSMMLLARDDEEGGASMTDQQVRDEALTIMLAGHETTANALTWSWYLLSQHPEVEARLHEEIDRVLAGRLPTAEDLPALEYAHMVFAESMRLYPAVPSVGRRAVGPHPIDGHTIPADAAVLMSQYVTHRDPRWWPEATSFRPERWADDASERPKFAYFPFGAGPRMCVGESFAWMEGVIILAAFAQRWRLRLVPGHPVEPVPKISLRPRHGMRMVVERRA